MSVKSIYSLLRTSGMTKEGACAMMGNMMAESSMRANNAQDIYGVYDEEYTNATDKGQNNFVNDSIGYGLCQWTIASRKRKLYAYAKSQGVSIADESMQVNFCIKELRDDFPELWKTLTTSHDLLKCTQDILTIYENPAVKNLGTRMDYAKKALLFFDTNTFTDEQKPVPNESADNISLAKFAAFLKTEEFKKAFHAWEEKVNVR